MSMKNIPIYAEGFLVDMTAAEAIMKANGIEPNETADPGHPFVLHGDVLDEAKNILNAEGIECFYCSGFDGAAMCPADVREYLGISEDDGPSDSFEDDCILMIPLNRGSELTKKAYASVDDIINEIKIKLVRFLPFFPASYRFGKMIRVLIGTTYC